VKAWDRALAMASSVFRDCAERGINLTMVNMGGGFPTKYLKDVPPVVQYGRSIFRALRKHFGNQIRRPSSSRAAAWWAMPGSSKPKWC